MMPRTTTIGGFFGLELPSVRGSLPPEGALMLRSGRACLRVVLEALRPNRLLVPSYICGAALLPARRLDVPLVFYGIDRNLNPIVGDIGEEDAVLVVNYFGLCSSAPRALSSLRGRLIVDQTQALFALPLCDSWAFASVRKWLGVPDGGLLWTPDGVQLRVPEPVENRIPDYLLDRLWGDAEQAYSAYVKEEAALDDRATAISTASVALMSGVDADWVKRVRRENFAHLAARLSGSNLLELELGPEDVPFCYPFLPAIPLRRSALIEDGIFVPRFWDDWPGKSEAGRDWERLLVERLLPLPVDHRYGEHEMDRVARSALRRCENG